MTFNKNINKYNSLSQKLIFTPLKTHWKYNQHHNPTYQTLHELLIITMCKYTTLSLSCGKR